MVSSPPYSPSPSKERGKYFLEEGLTPLLNTPIFGESKRSKA
jgi:hypothetical protein